MFFYRAVGSCWELVGAGHPSQGEEDVGFHVVPWGGAWRCGEFFPGLLSLVGHFRNINSECMFRSLCPLDIVDEKKTAIVEVADVYECGEHVNC